MYPKETNYGAEVDRVQMTYEEQLNKLHSLADRLAGKVSHISNQNLEEKGVPTVPHSTKLNRDIEEVINRFETIVANINN